MKPQQLSLVILLLTIGAIVAAVLRPAKFGLDIRGGARVVLEADTAKLPTGQTWDANTRSAVLRTIENRVNSNGVSEPVITTKGEKQFVVEIPSVSNEEEILQQLQNTAQLQFFYSADWKTQRNRLGRYDIDSSNGADGKREEFRVTDTTTSKSFRDLYHIKEALKNYIEAGKKAGANAQSVALPPALAELGAAGGVANVSLTADDAKNLDALAEEAKQFNQFLSEAKLQLDGSDLLPTARGGFGGGGGSQAEVELEFNSRGREKFANFTRDHTNEILMIYLDGRILMAPNIQGHITEGRASISPFATIKDAKQLADYLNGGALPVPLKIIQQQTIEPTLGSDAVRQGFTAGALGLGLVVLFMIAYYLLPGAVACVALLLYTLFTYAIFVLIPVTFTLPGIAGFILSVGMAVDANILIFERTKEELRAGRSLRQAIEIGFQRAFSAIFDSNMCTAVTSILLYYFGTGPVRGFALTLLLGVLISMFTAITVTRTLLLFIVRFPFAQNPVSWGRDRQWNPRMNVVKNRKWWYLASLLLIVPGIIFAFAGGFKTGIDFTGGSEMTLRFASPVTREAVEKAVAAQGITDPSAQIAGDNTVFVRLPSSKGVETTSAQASEIVSKLQTQFPGVKQEGFERIGGAISSELTRNALTSILFSSVFIVLYLAFRFAVGGFITGLKFGVAAIIAMLHDVMVLVGVFCFLGYLFNWKIDSLFVTAALTVIGFSVHDTIIIFDRIRENLQGRSKDADFDSLVNTSINETFARSINTSFTVVITLTALLILGGPVIRPLNAALLVGIISGTYSSIFNAAPLIVDWQRRFGKGSAFGASGRTPALAGGSPGGNPAAPRPVAPSRPTTPRPTAPRPIPPLNTGGNGTSSGETPGTGVSGPALPPGPPRRRRRM